MQIRLTLKPGQRGTKKLLARYGDRLACVRYRYDEARQKRYQTVELIVEEVDWKPQPAPDAVVYVEVQWGELDVWRQVKGAGAEWDRERKVWALRYSDVVRLGLESRIVSRR